MNGGYAARTNADRENHPSFVLKNNTDNTQVTLGDLIYWSMIESGLALIAACLPTLHHLLTRSPIKSFISSIRSTLKGTSFKSPFASKATTLNNPSAYSEISAVTKISQTSSRRTDTGPYVALTDEEENMGGVALAPITPLRAHIHSPHARSNV